MILGLELVHFRNFSHARFHFGNRVNILLGQNGQGKTNVLEALHLLVSGDTFRYAENETLIKRGFQEARLRAKYIRRNLQFDLELQILKSRRHQFINKKRSNQSDLSGLDHCVVFSPESLAAIKEGADHRRKLIDDLMMSVDEKSSTLIRDFRKALKSRNRILKDFLEEKSGLHMTQSLLEALNPSFFKLATELTARRILAIRAISPSFERSMQAISKNTKTASIEYYISGEPALGLSHQDIHNLLTKRAEELHSAELGSGTSLVGPQKHDVIFLYDENDSRFYASQGQQRALILSFKMAQIVYHRSTHGAYPLLLLDDVLSELDEEKRGALISFLQEIRTQIFMTTTDLKMTGDLAEHDCRVIELKDGMILESSRETIV